MTKEFDIIARYFTRPTSHTLLGIGDDAALIQATPGCELVVVSTDMLVSGVHFFAHADPDKLGHKTLAVNLSDMAAMGAEPRWATLAVALPALDESWINHFSRGFFRLALEHAVDLIGGDTTRGPLCLALQIIGEVPSGMALRRDGAQANDDVWISGKLGEAALGLAHLQGKIELDGRSAEICLRRLHTPQPRVALGRALRGVASAAIDISDGLLADLEHIATRSGVGAEVEIDLLPRPDVMSGIAENELRQAVLAGGDDYELCFCAPAARQQTIAAIAQQLQLPLTKIGRIVGGGGVRAIDGNGREFQASVRGFDHFEPS